MRGLIQHSIIFIHGLRGHPFKTWSVGTVCWPKDFLGQDIENARIVTWGYDPSFVNATKMASQDTIVGHAKSLLSDLSFLRKDKVNPHEKADNANQLIRSSLEPLSLLGILLVDL